jgi:superfamily II DNA/RNA helicase
MQKNELKQNVNFVIGTPGRIKDLIGERSIRCLLFIALFWMKPTEW